MPRLEQYMKNYYRVMLGRKSAYAEEAYKGNFIGAGFLKDKSLTHHLSDNWRDFKPLETTGNGATV